ncbi:mucin-16-like [Erpetoichthys calabaricus]|uniref:mucin-16-like n=1 Tax=Erpetoichthys calabaricus TaxID=27687 RepID=UPI002234955F|nr:mucin-16-like [Erpetoichthys calabaricus]
MTVLLNQTLNASSLSVAFSGCKLKSLSPSQIVGTAVNLSCTFKNNTSVPPFNKVDVFRQLNQKTNNGTSLGPYSMAKNSLYVSGYHEITQQPIISLLHFTINFTLPNLPFSQNLSSGNSPASRNVTSLISQMLQNTTMGSEFSSCVPISFSPSQVVGTAVSLSCTFKNETSVPHFNKVDVYRQLNQKTNNGTLLGPYSMTKNSLYVSGYREITPQPVIPLLHFTINFTLPNLPFSQNLSSVNNPASQNVTSLISQMLQNTTMGSEFSSCVPISFSASQVIGTAVSLSCTFKNNTSVPSFNKVDIYRLLNQKTNNGTLLGPYSMTKNSLYVSGYHEITPQPVIPLLYFTINFTLPTLPFSHNLSSGNNPASRNVTSLISLTLQNTTMGSEFSSCIPISFSPSQVVGTAVNLSCTFKNETSVPPFNKVDIYRQLNQKTNNGTLLGPYSMTQNSLYVSGYHEITPQPVIPLLYFTINFTLPTLPFSQNLSSGNNPASRNVTSLISLTLQNTTMGSEFSSCIPISFSPSQVVGTAVNLSCTFKNETSVPPFNKVDIYRQLNQKTNNGTLLGPYSITINSLYVSGYHEITPQPVIPLLYFTINFTLPTLPFSQNLSSGNSPASRNVTSLISQTLQNTTIGSEFSSCIPISFSPSQVIGTAVNLSCTFKNDTSVPPFNKVDVYRQLNQKTSNGTLLGPYSMAKDSLYVSGYHEVTPSPVVTTETTTPPAIQNSETTTQSSLNPFPLSFTVTQLSPKCAQTPSNCPTMSGTFHQLVDSLFRNSVINSSYVSCTMPELSPAGETMLKVNMSCLFKPINQIERSNSDNIYIYDVFRNQTNGLQGLGNFTLDKNSLFVDGYHEVTPSPAVTTETTTPPAIQNSETTTQSSLNPFPLSFTVTQLSPKCAQTPSNCPTMSGTFHQLVDSLFRNSVINSSYVNCSMPELSPAGETMLKVNMSCLFKPINQIERSNSDNIYIYDVFRNQTNGLQGLGPFTLDKNSLFVDGYTRVYTTTAWPVTAAFTTTSTYGTTPVISLPGDRSFSLNFTIINRNFTSELNDPNSDMYKEIVANITNKLAVVYRNSSLANNFRYCKVTGLRLGSVKVSCNCIFNAPSGTTALNESIVENIFAKQTNNTTLLGGLYQLQPDSLQVKDSPIYAAPSNWELSFWAIILIVIGIFVGLLLLCLLCFLASLLRRQKLMESYNVMNLPYGQYYSHLK